MIQVKAFITSLRSYITIGLLATIAIMSLGWYITDLKLKSEVSGRRQDRAEYRAAQSASEAKAHADARKKETEYVRKANKADADYRSLTDKYHAAVLRYSSAQSKARVVYLPGSTEAPKRVDGPSQRPDISITESDALTISESDALVCADNTARLEAARKWALDLEKPDAP